MKTLAQPQDIAEVTSRIRKVSQTSPRQWGRMSVHQMICHLNDSFRVAMGDRPAVLTARWLQRTVLKWMALYLPLPWPEGIKTAPEVNQLAGGTQPIDFLKDHMDLLALLEHFTQSQRHFQWQAHPTFGVMSEKEWLRWGYLHIDHHLRQFGA